MSSRAAPEQRVRELTRLAQDGALKYHGAGNEPGEYDVTITGENLVLREEDVLPFAARVTALAQLREAGVTLVHADGTTWRVRIGRKRTTPELTDEQVLPWVAGFRAGLERGEAEHQGQDGMAPQIGAILTAPTLADQCRLYLLALMDAQGLNQEQLAKMAGIKTVKTISKALALGRDTGLLPSMADRLIAALGRRWVVSTTQPAGEVRVPPADSDVPEAPAIARLRDWHQAQRAGWLQYTGPTSITKARLAHSYQVHVGQAQYRVAATDAAAWLRGLAAQQGQVH